MSMDGEFLSGTDPDGSTRGLQGGMMSVSMESGAEILAGDDDSMAAFGRSIRSEEALASDAFDIDAGYPPYILLDEDKYDELIDSIQMKSNLMMPTSTAPSSRHPSRPASPIRQSRIEEILARIDELIGMSTSNQLAASSAVNPLVQIQKHKHLVELVQTRISRECSPEETEMLFGLVSSVDQAHSKWAHPGRLGQAELYGSLERVLNELKAFTPYSVPFSTRVNRKDVPDYYDVIKKPMDLGTMMRKLKGFVYNTKREFQADLQKIYNNCFTYNTDPNSPLRLHVTLLRDKWTRLMAEVPDIEIKTIAIQPVAVADNGSETSSQSHSTLPSSTSQLPLRNYLEDGDLEADSDSQMTTEPVQALEPPPLIPPRSSVKMGIFHKARLKCNRKQKRKLSEMFYPEIALPFQHFPDPVTVTMRPVRRPVELAEVPPLLRTIELWRRLRIESALTIDGIDEDVPMASTLHLGRPSFEADSAQVIDRNTRALLGLLLASIGFEAFRNDAMSMLKDLLVQHILGICTQLSRRVVGTKEPVLESLRHALFPSQAAVSADITRLHLYAHNFVPGRQTRLEEAIERIITWRAEQRERAHNLSIAEIDVVHTPPEASEDDLDSVALDDEDLMALDTEPPSQAPPQPSATTGPKSSLSAGYRDASDLALQDPDLDIFGLRDAAAMSESVMTHELLALPKRTFDVSASGLEGTLDPIQFIGEPPIERLDDD